MTAVKDNHTREEKVELDIPWLRDENNIVGRVMKIILWAAISGYFPSFVLKENKIMEGKKHKMENLKAFSLSL